LSRQIFLENISEDGKEDNLRERENNRRGKNTLKRPIGVQNMINSGTPIV
jgi:hypothetical protein